jgi:hypothetical protein
MKINENMIISKKFSKYEEKVFKDLDHEPNLDGIWHITRSIIWGKCSFDGCNEKIVEGCTCCGKHESYKIQLSELVHAGDNQFYNLVSYQMILALNDKDIIRTVKLLASAISSRIYLSKYFYSRNSNNENFIITHIKQIKTYIIYLMRYVNICVLKKLDIMDIFKSEQQVYKLISKMISESLVHSILISNGITWYDGPLCVSKNDLMLLTNMSNKMNTLANSVTDSENINYTDLVAKFDEDLDEQLDYPMTNEEKNKKMKKFGEINYSNSNPHKLIHIYVNK